jgi:hypothetical protein
MLPAGDSWLASMSRHWYLDWDGPRPDRDVLAGGALVIREHEASERARSANAQQATS